jgi:hypothetical protein
MQRDARNVPAWVGEACYDFRPHRIVHSGHHDGNRLCRLFGGESCGRAGGNDDVGAEMHKFRSQQVEGSRLLSGKSIFDLEVLALDIAQLAKPRS